MNFHSSKVNSIAAEILVSLKLQRLTYVWQKFVSDLLIDQSLAITEVTQPIPVGPPRSLSVPTSVCRQQLTSMPEEESLDLNDEHKSEEIAAFMVAGPYSLTKSFKQGSVPVLEAHKALWSGTSHQPESHSQPAAIHQEAFVHSYPPPQQQRPQTALASRPLFQIPDSTLEKRASEGSLQEVIPDLENPPAEVKSKPVSTAMVARESLPAVQPPLPISNVLNTSYTVLEPGATPIEGASNQVPIERSISSLSDASTQTVLKGSPLRKQGKQM